MIQEDPKLLNPESHEAPENQQQVTVGSVDDQAPAGTVKQTVTNEVKELIKSYVDYAKNVDL